MTVDTSDIEWHLIAPYLPAGGHGGRPVALWVPKSRPGH
jgi:hypothetical protein